MAQAIAAKQKDGELKMSLSSNPDVVMGVMEKFRASGKKIIAIGVVNHLMPFMPNTAEVDPNFSMYWSPTRRARTRCLRLPTTRSTWRTTPLACMPPVWLQTVAL